MSQLDGYDTSLILGVTLLVLAAYLAWGWAAAIAGLGLALIALGVAGAMAK